MIKLRQWIGKEISFRMTPWKGGKFRGILVGYDEQNLYLYQYQNVVDLVKRRVTETVETESCGRRHQHEVAVKDTDGNYIYEYKWRGDPAKITPQIVIPRQQIIYITLAEYEEWYEEHKLDNPYFLDKWLQRGERKKKNEEFKRQHKIRMVKRSDMIKHSLIAAAVSLAGLGGAMWVWM